MLSTRQTALFWQGLLNKQGEPSTILQSLPDLPGGQEQAQSLSRFWQVPPFQQGLLKHKLSPCVNKRSQLNPLIP